MAFGQTIHGVESQACDSKQNTKLPIFHLVLGAWATAYLIHVRGVDEITVFKDWYHDIPRIGKSAAFEKRMGLSLADFYTQFDVFIKQSDGAVMKIFE